MVTKYHGCSLFCLEVLVNVGKVDKKLDNPFESDLLCEFVIVISLRMYLQMLDWNEFYIAFMYTQCGVFPRGFPTKHFIWEGLYAPQLSDLKLKILFGNFIVNLKPVLPIYRISSYSFHRNYSFLNLEIVANSISFCNISIFYLINWIFAVETIQGRKLYEEIWYIENYLDLFILDAWN